MLCGLYHSSVSEHRLPEQQITDDSCCYGATCSFRSWIYCLALMMPSQMCKLHIKCGLLHPLIIIDVLVLTVWFLLSALASKMQCASSYLFLCIVEFNLRLRMQWEAVLNYGVFQKFFWVRAVISTTESCLFLMQCCLTAWRSQPLA